MSIVRIYSERCGSYGYQARAHVGNGRPRLTRFFADALALLPGWANSKGAHLELHIAHRLGLEIGTVDEFAA